MNDDTGTVYINKLAAAARQLDAAIRFFFMREDELAIHTVAFAASRVLRDVAKHRDMDFTSDVFRAGLCRIAERYAAGTLPPDELKIIENSGPFMNIVQRVAADTKAMGGKFDPLNIRIVSHKAADRRAWPSTAANFLKHADKDAADHLPLDAIDNENVIMGACAAYMQLMPEVTAEIAAFSAFWSAKHHRDDDTMFPAARELYDQLRKLPEADGYALCSAFIHSVKALPD